MGEKKGDQQSRAELLGKMLLASGLQPYMLRHGSGREMVHLVLLRLNEADAKALDEALGEPVAKVKAGPLEMVALPLEREARIGAVDPKYYNAAERRWTATMAVARFQ